MNSPSSAQEALGIDFGGVILDRSEGAKDPDETGEYLQTPEVADAIDSIRVLMTQRFAGNAFIISKAKLQNRDKWMNWLNQQRFWERSTMPPENVRFCLKRDEKDAICQELGITHFVDDRLEVLSYMETVPYRYLLRPNPKEIAQFAGRPDLSNVVFCQDWKAVVESILAGSNEAKLEL